MSKLSEMIATLCPNGVEYRPLWSVTFWDKKFNAVDRAKQPKVIKYNYFLANDLKPLIVKGGSVKLLTTNSSNIFTTEELAGDLMSEGEVVTIPWGGNPNVQYYKGKFLTADNRIATSRDISILDNKYLFYFMQSRREMIGSFYRGSGIKHPDMAKVLDLEIPLPPLPVQREIVQILDNFANLTAELTAELAKRKKQYEHYRDMLLNFTGGGRYDKFGNECVSPHIEWKRLGEVAEIGTGSSNTDEQLEKGVYPFFVRSQEVRWKNEFEYDETAIITSGDGVGVGKIFHFYEGKYALHQRAYRIHIVSDEFLPKYVFYYMKNGFLKYIERNAFQSSVTSIRRPMLLNFQLPLISIAEQKRIVDILDRFDSLCNSLTEGLPAEIALRKKQYEYYRDKLLSFKEAS